LGLALVVLAVLVPLLVGVVLVAEAVFKREKSLRGAKAFTSEGQLFLLQIDDNVNQTIITRLIAGRSNEVFLREEGNLLLLQVLVTRRVVVFVVERRTGCVSRARKLSAS